MGAIASEIVHLLKVKMSLQNDQRWLLLLSGFSKFFGGQRLDPLPSRLENMRVTFQFKTAQHRLLVKFSILGLVWYLIVLIPDLCTLTYF